MNIDTVKMFFQNERNKLIGVGVATCLVTTAIVAPTTYFTGQPKHDGVIKPVAFNTVSATGGHLLDYGDLNQIEDEDGWGNEENLTYVITDTDLTRNVMETKDGIGFQALNVANQEAENLKGEDYKLNIMEAEFTDDDGTSSYIASDSADYALVAPINVYMRVPAPVSIFFKDNLMSKQVDDATTIWTSNVVSWKSLDGVYKNDEKNTNLQNIEALTSYLDWVVNENYLTDLLVAYTFFNWMLFNEFDDGGIADYPSAPSEANNPNLIEGKVFAENVNNMITNILQWTKTPKVTQSIYDQAKDVRIAGTGTADPYMQAELDSFNNFLLHTNPPEDDNSFEQEEDYIIKGLEKIDTDLSIDLFNEGSSTAWYMPQDEIKFDTNGDADDGEWSLEASLVNSYTPTGDAFISTQSRRSYYGTRGESISGMSQWGYGYQQIKPNTKNNEWDYMEQPDPIEIGKEITDNSFGKAGKYDESYANETPWVFANGEKVDTIIDNDAAIMDTTTALPLGFTATTDPLVFFTAPNTTFEHNGETYKPTGMTPEGTKLIFENPSQEPNITWDFLYSNGFINAESI